jgi:hypothetical protein
MPRSTVTRGEPENRKTEGRGYAACVASGRNDSSSLGRLNRGSNLPRAGTRGRKSLVAACTSKEGLYDPKTRHLCSILDDADAVVCRFRDGRRRPTIAVAIGPAAAGDERMANIIGLHNFVLYIITVICLFVLGLLVWIMLRFNAKANPTPSATTHNTTLEVLWTVLPVLILVTIAVPSFRLLYYEDVIPQTDMTVKAIGKQWFWTYEYPDNGNFMFDAQIVPDRRSQPVVADGPPRLLGTNNHVVVPVGKTVRLITTAPM